MARLYPLRRAGAIRNGGGTLVGANRLSAWYIGKVPIMTDDINPAPEAEAIGEKIKAKKKVVAPKVAAAAESVEEAVSSTAESLKDTASKLGKQAAEKARDYVSEGKTRAGGALGEVSRLMGDAAHTVDNKLGEGYGKYAHSAANTVSGWSEQLKNKDLDDFVNDARDFVKKSPAVAIGVAAALGFVIARVLRSGSDNNRDA